MSFETLLISCLSNGLTLSDFCKLKIGTILDIFIVKENLIGSAKKENKKSDVREATSSDNIMDFFL